MTTRAWPDWLALLWGGSVLVYPSKPPRKDVYHWSPRAKNTHAFLRDVRPYLLDKGAQCDIALALPKKVSGGRSLSAWERKRRAELKQAITILNQRGVATSRIEQTLSFDLQSDDSVQEELSLEESDGAASN